MACWGGTERWLWLGSGPEWGSWDETEYERMEGPDHAHFFFRLRIFHRLDVFIHSLTEGHLDCFPLLSLMNRAAVNWQVQVLLWINFQLIWVTSKEHDH